MQFGARKEWYWEKCLYLNLKYEKNPLIKKNTKTSPWKNYTIEASFFLWLNLWSSSKTQLNGILLSILPLFCEMGSSLLLLSTLLLVMMIMAKTYWALQCIGHVSTSLILSPSNSLLGSCHYPHFIGRNWCILRLSNSSDDTQLVSGRAKIQIPEVWPRAGPVSSQRYLPPLVTLMQLSPLPTLSKSFIHLKYWGHPVSWVLLQGCEHIGEQAKVFPV